ncbi:MAG: hypothetical protein J6T01_06645 [Kiritimatiellae bacterium]|nr:hypothetical protein [Kiritimatiellia bacterium]
MVIRPEEPLPIGMVCHEPETMRRVCNLGFAAETVRMNETTAFSAAE